MARCIFCQFKVASNGDRHRRGGCTVPGRHGEHHLAKIRAARRNRRNGDVFNSRGVTVAGTGKPSASSKEGKK